MTPEIDLKAAIDTAMEAELKASRFYRESKKKVSTMQGRELLEELANFEQSHYNRLQDLKRSLEESARFIEYAGTGFDHQKKRPVPRKVSEAHGVVEQNKDEVLGILSIAIVAETKAAKRYRELGGMTEDPLGKAMFHRLADEEVLHRRILADEVYHLNNLGGVWAWGD